MWGLSLHQGSNLGASLWPFCTTDQKWDARLWGNSRSLPDLGVSVTILELSLFLKTRNVCMEWLWGCYDDRWAPELGALAWELNIGYGLCAIFSDYPAYGRWSRFLHSPRHSWVSQKKERKKEIVCAFNNWATLGGTWGRACSLNYRMGGRKWFTILSWFSNPPKNLRALKSLQHYEVCLSQLCLIIFLPLHLCASGAQLRMEWAVLKDCEKDDLCGKPSTARSRKYQIYHGKSSCC